MASIMLRSSIAWLLVPLASGEGNHTGGQFEWAGIFATPASHYLWRMQKVDGAYAENHMKIVLLPSAEGTEEKLHALEAEAGHSFEQACTEIEVGETLVPAEDVCYEAHVDQGSDDSGFLVQASGTAFLAVFAEHLPTEFERDMHYLKDVSGHDVEPIAEESDHGAHGDEAAPPASKSKPWGEAIGASVLVCLCTLVGVVFLVPVAGRLAKEHPGVFGTITSAFAAGALLAAAFFLLLFEATHLVASSDEALDAASWGISILAGFLIPSVIDLCIAPILPPAEKGKETPEDSEAGPAGGASGRMRVLAAVLLGDFVHNLCDGVFIGAAFAGCGTAAGWKIAAASIYHEIAQEISDYFVLTDKQQGNLAPPKALLVNFVSGLSVILGTVIVLAQDSLDNKATGVLLGIGGGVYIQIGASECMAKVHRQAGTTLLRLSALLVFLVGAAVLGLVLLTHEHCVPEGEAAEGGGHQGHGHH